MSNININKSSKNLKSSGFNWSLIQDEMRKNLGSDIYESWLKKIKFIEEFNNYILLSVPTRFIRDWITSRYLDQILQIIRNYNKNLIRIEFKIIELNNSQKDHVENLKLTKLNNFDDKENISFIKDTYLQYNRIDPNKRFENFITGISNKLAFEASLKVSEKISNYNPF